MHFWGFTLQMELRRSGLAPPGRVSSFRRQDTRAIKPRQLEIPVPQQRGEKHRIPFKPSPSPHSPWLKDQTTHPDESTGPARTFSPCRGWFCRQSRFLRDSAANCLQLIMARHLRCNGFVCWLFGLLESPRAGHFRRTAPFIQSQFRTSGRFQSFPGEGAC